MPAEHLRIDVRCDAVVCVQGARTRAHAALGDAGWQAPISSAAGACTRNDRVDVVVSAAHARLFLLASAEALTNEARWSAYAESRFQDLYGEPPEGWVLRVVAERPGRARLAVALPLALMSALTATLGPALRSVRIDALNRLDELRHIEPRFSGAMLDLGERHTLLALMVDGVLERLRLRRKPASADELRAMVLLEWAALGRSDAPPAIAVGPASAYEASDRDVLRQLAPQLVRLH